MPREHPAPRRLLLPLLLLACKPPPPCGPPGAPTRVQLLATASDAPNIDDDGAAWPVNLRIYELAREPAPESLDFTALFTDAKAVLGDSLIATHEQTAFPAQRFGHQERLGIGVIQTGRMKLDELHVRHLRTRAIRHRHPVRRRHIGVRGIQIDLAGSSG